MMCVSANMTSVHGNPHAPLCKCSPHNVTLLTLQNTFPELPYLLLWQCVYEINHILKGFYSAEKTHCGMTFGKPFWSIALMKQIITTKLENNSIWLLKNLISQVCYLGERQKWLFLCSELLLYFQISKTTCKIVSTTQLASTISSLLEGQRCTSLAEAWACIQC